MLKKLTFQFHASLWASGEIIKQPHFFLIPKKFKLHSSLFSLHSIKLETASSVLNTWEKSEILEIKLDSFFQIFFIPSWLNFYF